MNPLENLKIIQSNDRLREIYNTLTPDLQADVLKYMDGNFIMGPRGLYYTPKIKSLYRIEAIFSKEMLYK
jgi:hypothetical protein